jgi:hypothetical protein
MWTRRSILGVVLLALLPLSACSSGGDDSIPESAEFGGGLRSSIPSTAAVFAGMLFSPQRTDRRQPAIIGIDPATKQVVGVIPIDDAYTAGSSVTSSPRSDIVAAQRRGDTARLWVAHSDRAKVTERLYEVVLSKGSVTKKAEVAVSTGPGLPAYFAERADLLDDAIVAPTTQFHPARHTLLVRLDPSTLREVSTAPLPNGEETLAVVSVDGTRYAVTVDADVASMVALDDGLRPQRRVASWGCADDELASIHARRSSGRKVFALTGCADGRRQPGFLVEIDLASGSTRSVEIGGAAPFVDILDLGDSRLVVTDGDAAAPGFKVVDSASMTIRGSVSLPDVPHCAKGGKALVCVHKRTVTTYPEPGSTVGPDAKPEALREGVVVQAAVREA